MTTLDKQWSDRTKKVAEPLFPGYVFVHIAPNDFVEALNNPWAVAFLRGSKGALSPSPGRDGGDLLPRRRGDPDRGSAA